MGSGRKQAVPPGLAIRLSVEGVSAVYDGPSGHQYRLTLSPEAGVLFLTSPEDHNHYVNGKIVARNGIQGNVESQSLGTVLSLFLSPDVKLQFVGKRAILLNAPTCITPRGRTYASLTAMLDRLAAAMVARAKIVAQNQAPEEAE